MGPGPSVCSRQISLDAWESYNLVALSGWVGQKEAASHLETHWRIEAV